MTGTLQPNPEPALPATPLVSPVLQDVLCAVVADELDNGKPDWADGNDADWRDAYDSAVKRWRYLREQGNPTHFDLVLAQVFTCGISESGESLYRRVMHLIAYSVQWAEHLAERGCRPIEIEDTIDFEDDEEDCE